jgi:hypothetical protein
MGKRSYTDWGAFFRKKLASLAAPISGAVDEAER